MSENIAGYIDRSYVKGQTYRYAATPAPTVFTGNINEISDANLLSKAMLVNRAQISGGELPNNFGNTFLITTVKYGNNTYLQTAYLIQDDYECWEYRRIYSNGWTSWIGVDSAINNVDGKIQDAKDTADSAYNAITGANGINSQISTINGKISTIENTKIPSLSTDIGRVSGRVTSLENASAVTPITYTFTSTGGKKCHWSIVSVDGYRTGNIVNLHIVFKGDGSTVVKGSKGYIGTLSGGPLPSCITYFTSAIDSGNPESSGNCVTVSAIIETSGKITLTNNGPYDKKWASTSRVNLSGTFIVNASNQIVEDREILDEDSNSAYSN